ncbi:MAG: ubiquinol-cytochrome C chaperone [Candidatus Puniceispirillum sp.]|jgi:cytochrome b pre-mRNA-processing protein 3|uniref:ubiquinol-cytochrome C chaperone family protein n=1 Tax=Candidatus Puniceispirillum sp. TaxID=2026719 RepID=UPI001EC14809|nr:ubiquinol-cytochrome C chaperone [Candidatus Puniceispirillum sp.]MBT6414891.1 ubiquinol-cytochrome C chaperone [Candidatus Puniceispirillum sp.]
MNSKENGWLKQMLGFGNNKQETVAEHLYGQAIEIARSPKLYIDYGVTDDVDGRFDALCLVVILIMRRLKEVESGKDISQSLFDSMFADMDLSLREMGAGDIGVSKRVRVMAEGFMGRLENYATALDKADDDMLANALARNLLRAPDASKQAVQSGLVVYVSKLAEQIDAVSSQDMLAGKMNISL